MWALHLEIIRKLLTKLLLRGGLDKRRAQWGCFGKFGIVFMWVTSFSGTLIWKPPEKENPPAVGVSFDQSHGGWLSLNCEGPAAETMWWFFRVVRTFFVSLFLGWRGPNVDVTTGSNGWCALNSLKLNAKDQGPKNFPGPLLT